MRYLIPLIASAAVLVSAALVGSPAASAEPSPDQQSCQTTAGGEYTGTGETECQSPGNVQIDATAPAPLYPYRWADEFYGSALVIGDYGPHGGAPAGGGGGGGGRR